MRLKRFGHNTIGRDFVIGDLHGMLDLFHRALDHVNFDPSKDRIFSVGDLIDRGPHSLECVRLLQNEWFHAVRGNHDQFMIDARKDRSMRQLWCDPRNGGSWSLDLTKEDYDECVDLLKDLPYVIVIGEGEDRVNILHAETFMSDEQIDRPDEWDSWVINDLIWGRTRIRQRGYDALNGHSKTYVGHTIVDAPRKIGSHVYIDTGAFLQDGHLTIVQIKPEVYHAIRR